MTPLEIWVVVLGVLVVGANGWMYWCKWQAKAKRKP